MGSRRKLAENGTVSSRRPSGKPNPSQSSGTEGTWVNVNTRPLCPIFLHLDLEKREVSALLCTDMGRNPDSYLFPYRGRSSFFRKIRTSVARAPSKICTFLESPPWHRDRRNHLGSSCDIHMFHSVARDGILGCTRLRQNTPHTRFLHLRIG